MKSMTEIVGDSWYGSAVLEEIRRLRKTIHPIACKYHAPAEQIQSNNTLYPFVLVLGNHSSGKSSFINYLLKRKVQATGVAPTDDNFTIIGHGMEDVDRNGPALVGDPDLGFQGLESFGSVLVNHTQLKIRSDIAIKDFMIVDSPGMIDSPMHNNGHVDATMDRGYNFEQVIRWYAERADVILLTFDPEKPGSTGETLSILTTSLVGLDHKLFIILNKADQFRKIHDFARAYGSLCWNLSKVIPRKDLPRIYTMCLPPHAIESNNNNSDCDHQHTISTSSSTLSAVSELGQLRPSFFEQGITDLEEARNDVIKETFNAPKRRVDNEISRFTEALSSLQLHCKIVDHIAHLYHSRLWSCRLKTVGALVASVGLTYAVGKLCDLIEIQAYSRSYSNRSSSSSNSILSTELSALSSVMDQGIVSNNVVTQPLECSPLSPISNGLQHSGDVRIPLSSSSNPLWLSLARSVRAWFRENPKQALMVFTGGCCGLFSTALSSLQYFQLSRFAKLLATHESIDRSIKDVLKKESISNDEHIQAMSDQILGYLPNILSDSDIMENLPRVMKNDMIALDRIQSNDIATLRRRASPHFPHLSPPPKVYLPSKIMEHSQDDHGEILSSSSQSILGDTSTKNFVSIDGNPIIYSCTPPCGSNDNTTSIEKIYVPVSPSNITEDNNVALTTEEQEDKNIAVETHISPTANSSGST